MITVLCVFIGLLLSLLICRATLQYGGFIPFTTEVAKTSAYTVLAADIGTLFTTVGNAGSLTFTLPSLATGVGGWWGFLNTVGQTMIITAPANKLVGFNNSTATSLTFSTASSLIGAYVIIWMNLASTFYYVENKSSGNVLTFS